MRLVPSALVAFISFSLAATACSFDYGAGLGSDTAVPELVLTDVSASRYENSCLSMVLSARTLEMYNSDSVWAGEGVSFVQYSSDGSKTVDAEGSAGILLVDNAAEVYSLGENISFHLLSDDFFFRADDLRWTKKTNRLASPADGEVSIEESDGSVIRGTGFFADTLGRVYEFSKPVTGQLVNESTDATNVKASGSTTGKK